MLKVRIPLIDKEVRIYVGKEEWDAWRKVCISLDFTQDDLPQLMPHNSKDGIACNTMIWVGDAKDHSTVFHESQHALSAIFKYVGCEDEEEMKAYTAGYLNGKIFEWLLKK